MKTITIKYQRLIYKVKKWKKHKGLKIARKMPRRGVNNEGRSTYYEN